MILTTTNSIEGHKIVDYLGIVAAIEVDRSQKTSGFKPEKTNIEIEGKVLAIKEDAFQQLADNAKKLGANAVVGIAVDIEFNVHLRAIISVTGTAVKVI